VATNRPRIFISYSHLDEEWKDRLVRHLRVFEIEDQLTFWTDRQIGAGDEWLAAIEEELEAADAAVLLVTTDFLISKFIRGREVPRLLERRAQQGVRIVPVIVKPCNWAEVPWLQALQCRPKDARPLATGDDNQIEDDLASIARELRDLLRGTPRRSTGAGRGNPSVSLAKLPATGDHFVARKAELAHLDAAWADPRTSLVVLVAAGGVGKSSLVNHWLDRLRDDGWRGAERVLGWSFYSQGTDATGASGDAFADYALRWLGYTGEPIKSPWEKGQELARRVREARTLLVLDGLEPLQHPPGVQTGRLKDPAIQALLRELQADNPGLCVVTTRIEVADVAGRAGVVSIDLDTLPKEAGAELLGQLGVKGKPADFEAAAAEMGGHALALTLLGTYLRDVCDGDVRRRGEVPLLDEESGPGAHARWVMRSYEAWLGDGPERQVLRVVGLFDRPAEAAAVAALRSEPITGLTEGLGPGEEKRWRQAVARLVRARLVVEQAGGLDAHPLVREHFGERLREEAPEAWQAGHARLYEHYRAAAPELPETLDAMMPLYTAVVHGCRAGRVQEAFDEVYWRRIQRGSESFSSHKLGAFGAELTALAGFFDRPWSKPSVQLRAADPAWVLNQAGFVLRALGRLPEAVEPTEAALELGKRQKDWGNAARDASNLSELQLTLGEVEAAVRTAAESVELAERSEDAFGRMVVRTTHADALHQAGRWEESAAAFVEAEGMQAEQVSHPRLYSLRGHRYCDLLLARAEPEDGLGLDGLQTAAYREACVEVEERARAALEIAIRNRQLLSIALDHLSLGRAHLGLALTSAAPDFTVAREQLGWAVARLREAGQDQEIPRGLLARAALHRLTGAHDLARADLTEAEDIATRGHMRLHETDAHLEWTRLHRDTDDLAAAREHLAKARALVDATGYERRRREVDWLTKQLASA
jgi:tetratricopeptide (TPR) repeat protein